MTTATLAPHTPTAPVTLNPTGDPSPVEKAVVERILDGHEPETFLWIVFNRPDGGARVWYAWTAGGEHLGNQADTDALTLGLDAADWIHITDRHRDDSTRGRITTQAYPLRPIRADILAGVRADDTLRDKLRRFADTYADQPRPAPDRVPRWLGVGPALLARNT